MPPRYVEGVEQLNENVTTNHGRKSLDLAAAGAFTGTITIAWVNVGGI